MDLKIEKEGRFRYFIKKCCCCECDCCCECCHCFCCLKNKENEKLIEEKEKIINKKVKDLENFSIINVEEVLIKK